MAQKRDYALMGGAAAAAASSSTRARQLEPAAAAAAAAASAPERAEQLRLNRYAGLPKAVAAHVQSFMDNASMLNAMRTATFQKHAALDQRNAHPDRVVWVTDFVAAERMFQERIANPQDKSLAKAFDQINAKVDVVLEGNSVEARRAIARQLAAFARTIHEYDQVSLRIIEGQAPPEPAYTAAASVAVHNAYLLDPPGIIRDWDRAQRIIDVPLPLPPLRMRTLVLDLRSRSSYFDRMHTLDFLRIRRAPNLKTIQVFVLNQHRFGTIVSVVGPNLCESLDLLDVVIGSADEATNAWQPPHTSHLELWLNQLDQVQRFIPIRRVRLRRKNVPMNVYPFEGLRRVGAAGSVRSWQADPRQTPTLTIRMPQLGDRTYTVEFDPLPQVPVAWPHILI